MISPAVLWFALFAILGVWYAAILWNGNDKRAYLAYAIAGSLLGFYFDFVSFTSGYYTYHSFYQDTLFGIPLTMTLAEGFSVAITIWLFDTFIKPRLH